MCSKGIIRGTNKLGVLNGLSLSIFVFTEKRLVHCLVMSCWVLFYKALQLVSSPFHGFHHAPAHQFIDRHFRGILLHSYFRSLEKQQTGRDLSLYWPDWGLLIKHQCCFWKDIFSFFELFLLIVRHFLQPKSNVTVEGSPMKYSALMIYTAKINMP